MRLLHTESSCGWGGQELRVISESRGMMDRGHEVLIAAPGEAPIIGEAKRLGIPVRPLAISRKRPAGWWAMRS